MKGMGIVLALVLIQLWIVAGCTGADAPTDNEAMPEQAGQATPIRLPTVEPQQEVTTQQVQATLTALATPEQQPEVTEQLVQATATPTAATTLLGEWQIIGSEEGIKFMTNDMILLGGVRGQYSLIGEHQMVVTFGETSSIFTYFIASDVLTITGEEHLGEYHKVP